jgi:hypothetical protein
MVRTDVARCSILVLSEDSAHDAHATLVELAKRMLRFIDPKCGIHRIRFEPPDNEQARRALRGNLWKSTNPREQVFRRALIGYIATKLLEDRRALSCSTWTAIARGRPETAARIWTNFSALLRET